MPNEPLDLQAVAEKLRVLDSDPNGVLTLAEEQALLAALREHRAALQLALEHRLEPRSRNIITATLAKVRD
jgi:hypothetical protein